jgi:hypothetical protein
MGSKTLAELKAENAEIAEKASQTEEIETPEPEKAVVDDVSEVDQTAPEETEAETETVEAEAETQQEPWQLQDDLEQSESENQDSDSVTLKQHIGMRKNLRGKLKDVKSENADLKAELEALKQKVNRPAAAPSPTTSLKPKREDYYSADDPEGAYIDALTDWKLRQQMTALQRQQAEQQSQVRQQQAAQQLSESVNEHYQRAATLANQSGIDAQTYQTADLAVRQAIEEMLPGQGDFNTDMLISKLGDGSEKVMYYLGRNDTQLAKLKNKLAQDPTGLSASMFLGELKASVTNPKARRSTAPSPAPRPNGDAGGTTPNTTKLKGQYEKAHKSGDIQAAWNAKRAAKKQGVDVSTW